MFKVGVRRRRHASLPKVLRGPNRVKVGFPAGEVDADQIQIAIWNHFGTSGSGKGFKTKRGGGFGGPIPERPFLSNAMRNHRADYRSEMKRSARKVLRGETAIRTVLKSLGQTAMQDVQKEMISLSSPPNSPVTIALKGSSNPLIDQGNLRDAVTWKVDDV